MKNKRCKDCRWNYFVWWNCQRECLHDKVYTEDFDCLEKDKKYYKRKWWKFLRPK